jgi:hypothetical protein
LLAALFVFIRIKFLFHSWHVELLIVPQKFFDDLFDLRLWEVFYFDCEGGSVVGSFQSVFCDYGGTSSAIIALVTVRLLKQR